MCQLCKCYKKPDCVYQDRIETISNSSVKRIGSDKSYLQCIHTLHVFNLESILAKHIDMYQSPLFYSAGGMQPIGQQ